VAISTTSVNFTPQANCDTYYKEEDFYGTAYFDVMLNDLGGNAKILWSVDDGTGGTTELITSDIGVVEAASNVSANGAKIWIANGKVAYDSTTLSAPFKDDLQALAVGETLNDTFTYAIRMANGTLAWTTATVVYTGSNDPPVANADGNGLDSVVEAGVNPGNTPFAGDPSASGNVLANDTDVDNGAVLSVLAVNGVEANVGAAITGTYGTVTINGDGSWSYDLNNGDSDTNALAQGQSATDVFNYTVTDEHSATSSSTLTITVTGTNDGPVAVADTAAGHENQTLTVNVVGNDTDVDDGAVLSLVSA
jgi:VCBS repeat-containing protein